MEKWKEWELKECESTEFVVNVEDKESFFSVENIKLCLVAKVLSHRRVNVESFRSVMKTIWKSNDKTRIETAGSNVFVIQFRSLMDKSYVLSEGPWIFDRALVILKSPNVNDNLSTMDFSSASMWIQIHNVPFNCMTRTMAHMLGSTIGSVEEVDCDNNNEWTGPFMRLRVAIKITKPLRRGVKLRTSEDTAAWCPILYEKLPDLCFRCGMIGHLQRECQLLGNLSGEKGCFEYGEWMKVTILNKKFGYG